MPSSPESSPPSLGRGILFLGLAVLTVFGLAIWAPFIYDDTGFMLKNPDVTGPWPGVIQWLASPLLNTSEYEPLGVLVHRFLYALGGPHPFVYRLSSLLLHWANAALVLLLYRRILGADSRYFWAALLFALYPGHTEVLAITTFKKHLLVSFFGLLLLHFQEKRTWPEALRLTACWSALALGLLAKESALLLPLLCLAVSLVTDGPRRLWRQDKLLYAGLGLLCLTMVVWRTFFLPRALTPLPGGSLPTHLLTSAKCLLWYLRELLVPLGLCQEQSLTAVRAFFSPEGLWVMSWLTALAAAALTLWRKDRVLALALFWCGLTLTPFLNLVPYLNLSLVANRYLYLASAGFFLGVGRLLAFVPPIRFSPRLALVPLLATALALLYSAQAMAHLARYSDPVELWTHTIACAPDNPRGHLILGQAYRERLRYPEAAAEFKEAIRLLRPRPYPDAYLELSSVYAFQGKIKEALAIMEMMSRYRPAAVSHNSVGVYRAMAGDKAKALDAFEQALRLEPQDGNALLNLGLANFESGRLEEAERLWLEAGTKADFRVYALNFLADLYERRKHRAKARAALEESLDKEPLQAAIVAKLARLYSTEGQAAKGLRLYDRLIAGIEERAAALRSARSAAQDASVENAVELTLQSVRRERRQYLADHPSK